ncbi:MAG TPA: RagB/SusD family nutrient uptake outer membrane protein [Puia sp.]|jgi:hypothetical protein
MKLTIRYTRSLWAIGLLALTSCNKLIEVTPTANITQGVAYSDSLATEANINGIYYQLQQKGSIYNGSYCAEFPLLSDEATPGTTTTAFWLELATNIISVSNTSAQGLWANNYSTIYQANSVIENVAGVGFLSEAKKNQFLGEARFLRAYCHFILTQYYGKIPLATTTDFKTNANASRADTGTVYSFIVTELQAAEKLLPGGYAVYGNVKTRVCKEAAQALLARVYLYGQDWANAETYATKLIGNPLFSMPSSYTSVLATNSPESIWELWAAAGASYGNFTASYLVPASAAISTKPAVIPSAKLVGSFEAGDVRKTAYLGYQATGDFYYVNKYRDRATNTDQPKMLRLGEMYLIRAEARAQQNKLTGSSSAAADLNVIRNRAGLEGTTATTQGDMLAAIAQERFIELLFEGHRWLDLKRTGQIDAVMSAAKPATWKQNAKLLPVPAVEIGDNPNLLPNNPGY